MNRLQIGDLVHIPASVPLLQFTTDKGHRMPLSNFITEEPILGVVIRSLPGGYKEIYCRGDKWAVSERSLYKIKEEKK